MKNDKNENHAEVPDLINQAEAKEDNKRIVNLVVDDIPYHVEYESFFFNQQVRYYVSVNAGPRDVFVWDKTVQQFRGIDDNSSILPVALEQAMTVHLLNQNLE